MADLADQPETLEQRLAGGQVELPILSSEQLARLCSGKEHSFVSYSDNIFESLYLLNMVAELSDYLEAIGVVYEPIDQPIYAFKLQDFDQYIIIKICGDYSNWELPPTVKAVVDFIDRPDVVICAANNKIQPIVVVETTGTANVGNSQWQREGRKVGAARNEVPFVYQTYYSGTDRSQDVKGGQPREPTSLQVLNHLIYSLRYQVPSLVIYFAHPVVDRRLGFDRTNVSGRRLLANYVATILCATVESTYRTQKKTIEFEIYQHMCDYITEVCPKRRGKPIRLGKDFPVLPPQQRGVFFGQRSDFVDFLVKWVNHEISQFKKQFDFTRWDFSRFKPWAKYYVKKPLITQLSAHLAHPVSYLSRVTKCAVCLQTNVLLKVLEDQYNPEDLDLQNVLDPEQPTLIIATRIFKGAQKNISPDPESGEITAFSELFAYNVRGRKTMNVVLYVHVEPPEDFDFSDFISQDTKFAKAIRYNADLVVLGNKCYEAKRPTSS